MVLAPKRLVAHLDRVAGVRDWTQQAISIPGTDVPGRGYDHLVAWCEEALQFLALDARVTGGTGERMDGGIVQVVP